MEKAAVTFEQGLSCKEQLLARGIYLNDTATQIRGPARLEPPLELPGGIHTAAGIEIGAFSYSWSLLSPSIASIGRYCSIAGDVWFGEVEHPTDRLSTSSFTYERDWMWGAFARRMGKETSAVSLDVNRSSGRITIGHDVWIGRGAYIKGGVHLGDGCVVGAKAVVTKNVPAFSVIVGNPGRVVRQRFNEVTQMEIQEMRWWRFAPTDLSGPFLGDISETLREISRRTASGQISPYNPEVIELI